MIYVRESISVKERKDFSVNILETLWLEVHLSKSKPFLISIVYRPPNSPQSWVDAFKSEFELAFFANKEIILMGDFYIDLKKNNNKNGQIC